MKIYVWRTGHEIADKVAEAAYEGLQQQGVCARLEKTDEISRGMDQCDIHIGYGILRGMDSVFKAAASNGRPYFNLDRGYWKPGHYDGYYRVSLRGTQQTTGLDKIEPDYERLDRLGIEIWDRYKPLEREESHHCLICPPTPDVAKWLSIEIDDWIEEQANQSRHKSIVRLKGTGMPIRWSDVMEVRTFNSSVGWEALRQGIPVVSDPNHSIVGAYQKMLDKGIADNYEERRKLFAIQSKLQLTLDEMRQGKLWPLLNLLLATSDGIPAKP